MFPDGSATTRDGIGRRTYLGASVAAVVGGGLLTGCLGSETDDEPDGSDWPTFAGNTANTGATTARGPDEATERWSLETNPIFVTPAVADGVVYAGETTIAGAENEETGGDLVAYDAATGDREWSHELVDDPSGAPTVADGVVYVAASIDDSAELKLEDGGNRLYAVGTAGDEQWTADVPGDGEATPTVVDGVVYVNTYAGTYAFDAETGDREWGHIDHDITFGAPAVVDGTVYVSAQEGVYTLDAETGEVGETNWQYSADYGGSASLMAPVVADGSVYVGSGSPEDAIVSVDAETGDLEWTEPGTILTQSIAVSDGTLYAGLEVESTDPYDIDSHVVALDMETGEERWTFEPEEVGAAVAVADETVFVRTLESAYALAVADGGVRWEYDDGFDLPWDDVDGVDEPTSGNTDWMTSAPAIAGESLFVGSPSGGLYAIGEN